MTDCKRLLQQRIMTSEQNAVFTQSDGERRLVEIGLHRRERRDIRRSGIEVDGTYYYDLLLLQQLLPAIHHVASEFIF